MNKILILIPANNARGGITNYYNTLFKYFTSDIIYQYRGARKYPFKKNIFLELFRLSKDYTSFTFKLLKYNIKLVQTTTSFDRNAILRDSIFILFAKILRKKVIVFYRGWEKDFEQKARKSIIFKYLFLKANGSIVLSEFQKKKLLSWGYKNQIYIESTAVDDEIVSSVSVDFIKYKYDNIGSDSKITLLFLARLEKTKGIFELLDAFKEFKKNHNVDLIIAGDGTAEEKIKSFIEDKNIADITLAGFVSGQLKNDLLNKSHIYILPSYSEGMPNAVLEAMSFGLPVLTTPVGGLIDFFKSGINGFFVEKYNVSSIVENLKKILSSKNKMRNMGLNNHLYAADNFLASEAAKRNMKIFKDILNA